MPTSRRTWVRILLRTGLVLAVLAGMLATAPASTAEPAPAEPGTVMVVAAGDEASAMDEHCGSIIPPKPCGIVFNLANHSLQAARDSKTHSGCDLWADSKNHPRKMVTPGRNTTQKPEAFEDTDCFRSTKCRVFYLGWHDPGEWIRIWGPVFVFNINC